MISVQQLMFSPCLLSPRVPLSNGVHLGTGKLVTLTLTLGVNGCSTLLLLLVSLAVNLCFCARRSPRHVPQGRWVWL